VNERLRRWSEDESVGRALAVAGLLLLAVQLAPPELIRSIARLWPLAVIAVGVLLVVRGGTKRSA
jgi:hypothetical protein